MVFSIQKQRCLRLARSVHPYLAMLPGQRPHIGDRTNKMVSRIFRFKGF